MIAAAVLGGIVLGFYALLASLSGGCDILNPAHGGEANSLGAAAALGGALWLGTSAAAWLLRRKLTLLFIGFVALYVVGLFVLSAVSSAIWGPVHCAAGAF